MCTLFCKINNKHEKKSRITTQFNPKKYIFYIRDASIHKVSTFTLVNLCFFIIRHDYCYFMCFRSFFYQSATVFSNVRQDQKIISLKIKNRNQLIQMPPSIDVNRSSVSDHDLIIIIKQGAHNTSQIS